MSAAAWQRAALALAATIAAAVGLPARAQYRPEVPVLKCAHVGEPVPDVPGATFQYLGTPRIDAAGNVLVNGYMTGLGITDANNEGLWFGQPGALALVVRDGWPAPDLPGVVFSSVASIDRAVSETGWIEFTARVSGSGISPGFNDRAIFCGPPGDFRLVKQTGDPVPELGPDIVISGTESMGAMISDNGTLSVGAGLAGSLPPTYNRAYWVGPRDALQLAAWDGMPVPDCPTCDPADYVRAVGTFSFNDAGELAFGGALTGPGVDGCYKARFIGPPSGLTMIYRTCQLVPECGPDVVIANFAGVYALNAYGDPVNRVCLDGPGISGANDWALVGGETSPTAVIAREGDPTPEAGAGRYVTGVSSLYINNLRQVLFAVTYNSNTCGVYFGAYAAPRLILLDGAPAHYLPTGTVHYRVSAAGSAPAMNSVGDFIATTSVERGGTVTNALWIWRASTGGYVPLVLEATSIQGRDVTLADPYSIYSTLTGGADGFPQSFNDRRQLATLLDFTDGTSGVYRIGPPLLGDTDGDGQLGPAELLAFAGCVAGPGGWLAPGCDALDLNLDTTIDLRDLALLQAMVGEER